MRNKKRKLFNRNYLTMSDSYCLSLSKSVKAPSTEVSSWDSMRSMRGFLRHVRRRYSTDNIRTSPCFLDQDIHGSGCESDRRYIGDKLSDAEVMVELDREVS
jgi:hypothetical protein